MFQIVTCKVDTEIKLKTIYFIQINCIILRGYARDVPLSKYYFIDTIYFNVLFSDSLNAQT